MLLRVYLFASAVIWAPYGMYCFFFPEALGVMAGVEANSLTGSTEIRAMYGGVQLAFGLGAALAFFESRFAAKVLFAHAMLIGGLFTTRTLAAITTSDYSFYTVAAMALEVSLLAANIFFYRQAEAQTSSAV